MASGTRCPQTGPVDSHGVGVEDPRNKLKGEPIYRQHHQPKVEAYSVIRVRYRYLIFENSANLVWYPNPHAPTLRRRNRLLNMVSRVGAKRGHDQGETGNIIMKLIVLFPDHHLIAIKRIRECL